jgi:hypothetical protein
VSVPVLIQTLVPMSLQVSTACLVNFLFILSNMASGELNEHNKKLGWLVGKWRSEFSGWLI